MKVFAFIKIDNIIDIITNSSSELFVIEKKLEKETIEKLIKEAIGVTGYINERLVKDKEDWEVYIDDILENFPESDREELRKKYFTESNWYAVSFDRDWVSTECNKGNDVRAKLYEIGFELIDTDY